MAENYNSALTSDRPHMKSLWNEQEAALFQGDLAQRVYTSRLLGRDKSLVLHGGGNTSVKASVRNLVGEDEQILYVKGSGWDLEFIEEAGFSPVRMPHLLKLAKLQSLSDPQMVNELVTQMTRAAAPAPSVETILHALLPHKFVDHTHACRALIWRACAPSYFPNTRDPTPLAWCYFSTASFRSAQQPVYPMSA